MTNEMTAEEARRILIDIADQMPSDVCADWIDAVCIGIKAIDAQLMRDATEEERKSVKNYIESISKPTGVQFEDCISREAVQDLISRWLSDYLLDETREALETINYKVGDMPSVTPKYTDEEIDKAQAVEQAYVDKMVELAVEETKRPKGKWIDDCGGVKCSCCGYSIDDDHYAKAYCTNCGAEMSGGEEDGAETR